jgi:hypothetical protein
MDGVVGLDIGSDTVMVAVLTADGQELCRRWEIANSEAGATALCRRPAQLGAEHGIERWRIGVEASSLYWWPLASRTRAHRARDTERQRSLLAKLRPRERLLRCFTGAVNTLSIRRRRPCPVGLSSTLDNKATMTVRGRLCRGREYTGDCKRERPIRVCLLSPC